MFYISMKALFWLLIVIAPVFFIMYTSAKALFWFLVILTPIVFIHELGHFLFARLFGVKIEVFSIGFGKPLIKWKDSKDTVWQIALIPLGGYVKMFGDEGAASTPDKEKIDSLSEKEKSLSFHHKNLWQKSLIVFGGPFANYLLTIIIFIILSMHSGVKEFKPEITGLQQDSPAQKAGLEVGDLIVDVNGDKVDSPVDLKLKLDKSENMNIEVGVVRQKSYLTVNVAPKEEEYKNIFGEIVKSRMIGVYFEKFTFRKVGVAESFVNSFYQVGNMSYMFVKAIWQMITLKRGTEDIGGPIKIALYSESMAKQGFMAILYFVAMISLNLGLINLFPIPMLDGGHLFFYGVEAIIRRPINHKVQVICFKIGFFILIGLMSIAFWNDLKAIEFFKKLKLLLG